MFFNISDGKQSKNILLTLLDKESYKKKIICCCKLIGIVVIAVMTLTHSQKKYCEDHLFESTNSTDHLFGSESVSRTLSTSINI